MRILLMFVLLFSPLAVFAQSILINEIAWMGTPVMGVEENQWWRYEWIELYNSTDTVGMLDGWTLELYRDKLDFTVLLEGTIVPNGYYVVGASDKIPNLDLNYKNLGGKFFNGGQRVVLKNSLGEIIDEVDPHYLNLSVGVDATLGWPAGDNKTKQTMERVARTVPATWPASNASRSDAGWQTSKDSGGTPKAANSAGIAKLNAKLNLVKDEIKLNLVKDEGKLNLVKDKTEKDLLGSSQAELNSIKFQSRVPIVNPITLLAGFLALGFSGVLLALKRFLALRQGSSTEAHSKSRRT